MARAALFQRAAVPLLAPVDDDRSGDRRGAGPKGRTRAVAPAVVALVLVLAACGAGGSAEEAPGTAVGALAPGAPVTVGVLTSMSGPAAVAFTTVEAGVKARLAQVNAAGGINGHKVQYVMADDASSPQGAAAAVNKMVRANIFGLLSVSSQFGAAAAVTRKAGLPVVGAAFDSSPAWSDPNYTNLFSASGTADPSVVATTFGTFFTSRGATKVAAAGGGSVSSAWVTAAAQKSAVHMGLKAGYLNTDVPTGSTDPAVVAKIVQGVRSSGSDALYLPLATNTAFAVIAGLRQAGVKMKSILVATGYGGELLKSPDAVKAAQGVDFVTLPAPVELGSQATKNFAGAVRKYGGSTDASSFGTYMGWVTADLFIHGMVATGPIVTRDGFIAALRVTSWSAGGLEGITDFSNPRPVGLGLGPENCMYVLKVQGKKFVPLPGAEPACGKVLLGVTTGFTFR